MILFLPSTSCGCPLRFQEDFNASLLVKFLPTDYTLKLSYQHFPFYIITSLIYTLKQTSFSFIIIFFLFDFEDKLMLMRKYTSSSTWMRELNDWKGSISHIMRLQLQTYSFPPLNYHLCNSQTLYSYWQKWHHCLIYIHMWDWVEILVGSQWHCDWCFQTFWNLKGLFIVEFYGIHILPLNFHFMTCTSEYFILGFSFCV